MQLTYSKTKRNMYACSIELFRIDENPCEAG